MKKRNMNQRCVKIKVEEAILPKDGWTVLTNRWWIVKDECVMLFKGWSPQCNSEKKISESIRDKIYPGAVVRFLEAVFVPPSQR